MLPFQELDDSGSLWVHFQGWSHRQILCVSNEKEDTDASILPLSQENENVNKRYNVLQAWYQIKGICHTSEVRSLTNKLLKMNVHWK